MLGNDFNPVTGQIELVESYEYNPATTAVLFEDWNARTTAGSGWNWAYTIAGTAVTNAIIATTAGNIGLLRQQITHSAANTCSSLANMSAFTSTITGSGIITIEARLLVEANTTNVTEREVWVGLGDATTVTPTNGVFIGFAGLTAANPFWQGRTVQASVTTTSSSVVSAVTNSTYTYLKYVINATSTSVAFYVNNTLITTMALSGSALSLYPVFYFRSVSSAAATGYGVNHDLYKMTYTFTNQRL